MVPNQDLPTSITIMFTDIVKSTDMRDACVMDKGDVDGDALFGELQEQHNAVLDREIRDHGGIVFSTAGDAYHVQFPSPRSAIECAVSIQRRLANSRIRPPSPRPDLPPYVQLRIGVHTGVVRRIIRGGRPDWDGHGINVVARIQSLATPEHVFVSKETWERAGTIVAVRAEDLGPQSLKGIQRPVHLIDVRWS